MNPIDAAKEPGPPSPAKSNRSRKVTVGVALLMGAASLWFVTPHSTPPPEVIILPANYSIQPQPMPIPDRWIPQSWGWLWKLRYALLGKPAAVTIDTEIVAVRTHDRLQLQRHIEPRPPHFATNGLRAWILPKEELDAISACFYVEDELERQYSAPTRWPGPGSSPGTPAGQRRFYRTTLGSGVVATLNSATTGQFRGIGCASDTLSYTANQHGGALELTGRFVSTGVVIDSGFRTPDGDEVVGLETNLNLAARMQIPAGYGAFLYDTSKVITRRLGVGLLIRVKSK